MKTTSIPWRRILSEGLLIIASVLIAISLESQWQIRSDKSAARQSLKGVLNELEADKLFLAEVREEQEALAPLQEYILEWLSNPSMNRVDSLNTVLSAYDSPLSMWPRNAAWSSMLYASQLRLIDDTELTSQLGEHVQFRQERILDASRSYDAEFGRLQFETIPLFKNLDERSFQSLTQRELHVFKNQVIRMGEWTRWYLEKLEDFESNLDSVIDLVQDYLDRHDVG